MAQCWAGVWGVRGAVLPVGSLGGDPATPADARGRGAGRNDPAAATPRRRTSQASMDFL